MSPTASRRTFLLSASALSVAAGMGACGGPGVAVANPHDVRIEDVRFEFEDHIYRFPHVFGGFTTDRCTLLNVHVQVADRQGRTAEGFGSMTMGNIWSWKTQRYSYSETLEIMKKQAARASNLMASHRDFGHPIEINADLEPAWMRDAETLTREDNLEEAIPALFTLVTTSPFDAALHDAYGKLHGRSAWACYGREFMNADLSRYLGDEFKGQYPDRYVDPAPKPRMPIFHNVGLGDPVLPEERDKPLNDGLPELLGEWVKAEGITHVKIKMRGNDDRWDLERILNVDRICSQAKSGQPNPELYYSLDFNEQARDAAYVVEFLRQLKDRNELAFDRIQYLEQPTSRYLHEDRQNLMHEAAALRPVVIDEALLDVETLRLAEEMGYTGCALKACKGQSHTVVIASLARARKLFLTVQDLTCPAAAFIHSAAIAAHVPGVAAIEANGRQYVPSANEGWKDRFPGLFTVREGQIATAEIKGNGLGAVP
jgi:L-alanine-DL-glutamate epimerase-like enolase superfamily enzyme